MTFKSRHLWNLKKQKTVWDWFQVLMKRHLYISKRKAEGLLIERVNSMVNNYLDVLVKLLTEMICLVA